MTRWLFVFIVSFPFLHLSAQIRWDGEAGDGVWNSALNWTSNTVPLSGEIVLLDNSIVNGNYVVTLPAGNVSTVIARLEITPLSSNTITLINPNTNTSPTAFTATGAGDAIVLNNGAIFLNASGASSGTPVSVSSTNFFRINNGGRYIHRTARGHTDFLASRLSTAAGTEAGIFEFDVPSTASYTISGSNRIYGTLIFSAQASGGTKTYTSSGTSPLQTNSDFILKSNVVFSYGANISSIRISQDCKIDANAVFNISNGANSSSIILKGRLVNNGIITESGTSTGSGLSMNGNSVQSIEGTGNITQSVQFTINNSAGVILQTKLILPYRLHLISGRITSSTSHLLAMADNAVYTGGSSSSFVEGPMSKIGDEDFIFPIGKGAIYAPLSITGGGNVTDEFTAEYIRENPQSSSALGNILQSTIHHISFVEYWTLNQNVGNSSRIIGLTVTPQSFARVLNSLKVARFDSGIWYDEGGEGFISADPIPPYIAGSFVSAAPVNKFSFFTIGTSDTYIINPLPLKLISFSADLTDNGYCRIYWTMGKDYLQSEFEVQRSVNGTDFITIGKLKGILNVSSYFHEDRSVQNGDNYYRLKIIDSTATVFFSKVHHLSNRILQTELIATTPIVVDQILKIKYSSSQREDWEWILVDMNGSVLFRSREKVEAGIGWKEIRVGYYRTGNYLVVARTKNGMTNVLRWIKN